MPTTDDIAALQEATEASKRAKWEKTGCCYNTETKLWVSKDGEVVASKVLLPRACSSGSWKWPLKQTRDAEGGATSMAEGGAASIRGLQLWQKIFVEDVCIINTIMLLKCLSNQKELILHPGGLLFIFKWTL